MPRCRECGNENEFITAHIEFQVNIYQSGKLVDNYGGDRERVDEQYPPECKECGSTDIEGEI